jgi:hypothetical protein
LAQNLFLPAVNKIINRKFMKAIIYLMAGSLAILLSMKSFSQSTTKTKVDNNNQVVIATKDKSHVAHSPLVKVAVKSEKLNAANSSPSPKMVSKQNKMPANKKSSLPAKSK